MPPSDAFTSWSLPAPLNGVVWNTGNDVTPTLAVISGNGSLHLLRADMAQPLTLQITEGAALLSLIATPEGFVTGSDEGHLHLTTREGETTLLHHLPGQFIEHLAYSSHAEQLLAAHGKKLSTFSLPTGQLVHTHVLPSSIGGLAASPIGRRAAAAHYNGASIVDLAAPKNPPRLLEWKGSHLATTYSPDGKWLITAMQEQSLHLWRLSDGMDLQMRGYPGPITQLSWGHDAISLATTGGSGVPLWSFRDKLKGPAGTQANVVADSGNTELTTSAVAMHPKGPFLAVGYVDGLALLANWQTNHTILLKSPEIEVESQTPLTHLAWSADGLLLALTDAKGTLTLANFTHLA